MSSPARAASCAQDQAPCLLLAQASLTGEDFNRLSRDVYLRLREDADRAARDRLDREERSQRRNELLISLMSMALVGIATLAAYLGFGKLDEMKGQIKAEVEPLVEDMAARLLPERLKPMQDSIGRLERQGRFQSLHSLVKNIAQSDSFSKAQRDQAMAGVREFSTQITGGEFGEDGKAVVQGLVESLFQASNWAQLRELEKLFPEMMSADTHLRNILLQAYQNLVFSPAAAPNDLERGRFYALAAWNNGFGETALASELLYLYRETSDANMRRAESTRLLGYADTFDESKMGVFLNAFGSLLDPRLLAKQPEPGHHAIAEVATAILDDQWQRFDTLSQKISPGILLRSDIPGLRNFLREIEARKNSRA